MRGDAAPVELEVVEDDLAFVVDVTAPLSTGLFADLGRFKVPPLRGLASRAPYFHDGHSATLRDLVELYNTTFNMNLSEADKADLTAYLETL